MQNRREFLLIGAGVTGFRDPLVTKFGWNIDQQTSAAHRQFLKAELTELTAALNRIATQGKPLPDCVQTFSDFEAPLKQAPTKS